MLLVEDSKDTQALILNIFCYDFQITVVDSLALAKEVLERGDFAVVLLDINLPDGNGLDFYSKWVQSRADNRPSFFFLTASNFIQDKVMGLTLGAEDYIVKPFNSIELKTRVLSRMKKINSREMQNSVLIKGCIKINTLTQEVYLLTKEREILLDLTRKEFKLLLFFFNHENQVVSRNQILDQVWSDVYALTDRTVDVHICKLRKKIAQGENFIQPIHGVGYKFNAAHS